MESTSEPAAVLTPLSPSSTQEANPFDVFKKACIQHGLLDAPVGISDDDVRDGINDDATLLRFLQCRQFDIRGALRQFQDAYTARQVNHVCMFYENIEVKDYEETQKLYPQWIGRRDKRGLPICTFDIGKLDSKTMAAYRSSTLSTPNPNSANSKAPGVVSTGLLRSFAFFDGFTRFIMPLLSAVPGRPDSDKLVTKMLIIADISGLDMRQLWNLKRYIQDLSKLLAINYPEILDRVLIVGAPSYVSTLLSWVKHWVDPVTLSKLVILSPAEALPTMKEYIDVTNIPKRFGGELEHEHGAEPLLDSAINEVLTWLPAANASLPMGPVKWIDDGEEYRVAVAVGREGGAARRDRIAILNPQKTRL